MYGLFQWITRIKYKEVIKGKTLLESTKYQKQSYWWFLRTRLYFDLVQYMRNQKRLYRPISSQVIIGRFSFIFLIYLLLVSFTSKLIAAIFPLPQRKNKSKILISSQFSSIKKIMDKKTGLISYGHMDFNEILQNVHSKNKNYHFTSFFPFGFSFFRNLRKAILMRQSQAIGGYTPLEAYLSIPALFKIISARKYFSGIFKEMRKEARNQSRIVYGQVDILNSFRGYFDYYFHVFLPLMAMYYEMSLNALHIEKPKLILLSDEYLGFGKALLLAAKENKIPVLAIQHGLIHEYHIGYIYSEDEISPDGAAKYPFNPIPTVTAVTGPFYKDILTKASSYPQFTVQVTGQSRYDVLKSADQIYSREKFCKKHGLNPTKTIALIATQPFPLVKLRLEFLEKTVKTLNNFDKIQIVIKPHPNENREWLNDQINLLGIKAKILLPKSDMIEAIFSCDLFLSVNSTTILEALALHKPVIVVNLSKLPEILPWVNEGVVLGVFDEKLLTPTVESVLHGTQTVNKLKQKRAAFLHKHLFKIDGKASERITAIIDNLIENNGLSS